MMLWGMLAEALAVERRRLWGGAAPPARRGVRRASPRHQRGARRRTTELVESDPCDLPVGAPNLGELTRLEPDRKDRTSLGLDLGADADEAVSKSAPSAPS